MQMRHDISGYCVFSGGELGRAHVMAHRLADAALYERGHATLGTWLSGRHGENSAFVHLHWHMLVFELALGRWSAAEHRCRHQILPAARRGDQAVTDAPAALWRLQLAAGGDARLPWEDVRNQAIRRLYRGADAYARLHDLLALGGAGDVSTLEAWIAWRPMKTPVDRTLDAFARAFAAYALEDFGCAVTEFERALPGLGELGGSRAQNELFVEIYRDAFRRCAHADPLASTSIRGAIAAIQ